MDATGSIPAGTAEKFDRDGRVKPFPGNTFVSALDQAAAPSRALAEIAARLKAASVGARLTYLPRSSYHMTVFEGVCMHHRDAPRWPKHLRADASLDEASAYFERRIAGLAGIDGPIAMRATGLLSWTAGLVVALEPARPDVGIALRALRDRLAEATGLRKPGHEGYVFHITLAYWLSRPDDDAWRTEADEIGEAIRRTVGSFELPAPDFCDFADMHAFVPRLSLATRRTVPLASRGA